MTDRESQTLLAIVVAKALGFVPCTRCWALNLPWRRKPDGEWRCRECEADIPDPATLGDHCWERALTGSEQMTTAVGLRGYEHLEHLRLWNLH